MSQEEKQYTVSISKYGEIVFHGKKHIFQVSPFGNSSNLKICSQGGVEYKIRAAKFAKVVDFLSQYEGELDTMKLKNGALILSEDITKRVRNWTVIKIETNCLDIKYFRFPIDAITVGTILAGQKIHRFDKFYSVTSKEVNYSIFQKFLSLYEGKERERLKTMLSAKIISDR